ncbi:hypothetical protein H310_05431 [Aphanomyces invadans]|uniref:Uncharacterized protein n=2 Tax=Aphanomyces invadans TaxID=157072 RepID=A0A024U9W8_9STRA|nr:hypothetical protein H310_05431 [Aphanomyces invadans]ETW02995.1 hypothetical protein H310_05431 [Aphanomyces invadans]|eukprot:XP_008868379.1 hypothetical protein H310_05431 [Aphanomyces invadans]
MDPAWLDVIFGTVFLDIASFMDGKPAKDWTDAYAILKAGHVQLLYQQDVLITTATLTAAADDGRLDLVKWICSVDNNTWASLSGADRYGHGQDCILTIQGSAMIRCACQAMTAAARSGHLNIVKYLYATIACIDVVSAIQTAADTEHYEVAMWLERQVDNQKTNTRDKQQLQQHSHLTSG